MMAATVFNDHTVLVSVAEAQAVVASIESRGDARLLAQEAIAAARRLMGLFPAKAFNDVACFAEGLAALLSAYDRQFVSNILSPVDGIATRLKYAITLAEVKEALEEEKSKRLSILSTARWTIKEHERRKQAARERAPLTPEEEERRVRLAATLLGPRNMADAGENQQERSSAAT